MPHLDFLTQTQATKINSAFYLYDEARILESFARFRGVTYPETSIFFASMANDNSELLKMVRDQGFGIFINSLKHLRLAEQAGFAAEKIIFASTGLSAQMMTLLVGRGIRLHLDSIAQIELYGALNPGATVGLRINTSEKSRNSPFTGNESRIGIQDTELPKAMEACAAAGLKVTGAHVYIGTDIVSVDEMMAGVSRTLELCEAFPDLGYLDFGGGFPLDETQFDFADYNHRISAEMEAFSARRGRKISMILEPGRAMFGSSGKFYARVTDIKPREDRYILCVDASASLIPRAMFYEDFNPVQVAFNGSHSTECEVFDKPVDVVGNTTYSRDFLAKKITLQRIGVGDWLEFGHAGSYCYSMITRFLGQTFPPEYLVGTDGELTLIRQGDLSEELIK